GTCPASLSESLRPRRGSSSAPWMEILRNGRRLTGREPGERSGSAKPGTSGDRRYGLRDRDQNVSRQVFKAVAGQIAEGHDPGGMTVAIDQRQAVKLVDLHHSRDFLDILVFVAADDAGAFHLRD